MITIQENVALAPLTTFDIGGSAKFFTEVESLEDLREAMQYAKERDMKYFVFSGGSNILFSDHGFDGLVIKIAMDGISLHGGEVMCGAGTKLMDLLVFAAENALTGGENLTGIPGSVGGAVRGNAGAFSTEIKDIVKEVYVYDVATDTTSIVPLDACAFGYRSSFFKKNPDQIIISATFTFVPGKKEDIQSKMYNIIAQRNSKQIQDIKSAGSWFINPEVGEKVRKIFEEDTGQVAHGGRVPAGWLLATCGVFQKRIGDIQAGIQHANYFINMENGTAEQAMQLSAFAKTRVRDEYEVNLKEEVVLAGF